MKLLFGFLAFWLVAFPLFAQTNAPVRLALIAESPDAAPVVDALTAQLSGNDKIQLLERDAIEKVYREQGISAGNRNDVKLGRILGADGLLLVSASPIEQPAFSKVPVPPSIKVTIRLVAVKTGVILTEGTSTFQEKDMVQWMQPITARLHSFLPKLEVSAQDAIPLSIVNLSSSIQSADELETERQLKLLTIQRLSDEPQFFVLERQKMQLLSQEKNLKSDESSFWNGSYLLEGSIDQNGYSKETITINARLIPPKGASPLLFEVSGSRTNLAEVINALAAKVTGLLKINSSVKEWNAADEASRYFQEASWALKWDVPEEAQAASESAWALGKKDLDCALVRVKAYTSDVSAHVQKYQTLQSTYGPTYDAHYHPVVAAPGQAFIQKDIARMVAQHPCVMQYHEYLSGDATVVDYAYADTPPDPENIDRALYTLEIYNDFSRTSPQAVLKPASEDSRWKNSEWYDAGVQGLVAASQVLQNFYMATNTEEKFSDKLADLRALTRSVAALISESPTVHDSYFVGDRIVTRDELSHTIEENPNIFRCEVNWGCFWQEKPEETISLYRGLMTSPVFCYIHYDFWNRDPIQPRMVAWNQEDRGQIPVIWNNFMQELKSSTNVFWNEEANALEAADAPNDIKMAAAFKNLFNGILSNRDTFVSDNVEVMYLDWYVDNLVEQQTQNGIASDAKDSIHQLFYSNYRQKFEAMDQEYLDKTIPALKTLTIFEKQKQYLANFTPYDFQTFDKIFSDRNYNRAQAAELLPLVVAYESNMIATAEPRKLFFAKANANWVGLFLEKPINQILNHPVPTANIATAQNTPAPARPAIVAQKSAALEEVPPNILQVLNFIKIPSNQIQTNDISGNQIFAQRWSDNKLLFGIAYSKFVYEYDSNTNWVSTHEATFTVIAIFDPVTANWDIIPCPGSSNSGIISYGMQDVDNRFILFHGSLFSYLPGLLQKFDFHTRQWSNVDVPGQDACDLYSVAGHLYAMNGNAIFELAADGTTHILASTRRSPPMTTLDSLDSFSVRPFTPSQLFSGLDQSLYVAIGQKIYRWDGNDWHEILSMEISRPPNIFEDAVIFRDISSRGSDEPSRLWIWDEKQSQPWLALFDKPTPNPYIFHPMSHKKDTHNLHPFWNSLSGDYLVPGAVNYYQSNLYLFVEHTRETNIDGRFSALARDGYHAKLIYLDPTYSTPIVVPLKFDTELAPPPLETLGKEKEPWLGFDSSALDTTMHFSGGILYLNERACPGVWSIPVAQLDASIAAQKQIFSDQLAKTKAIQQKAYEALLAEYDRNHNGVIDPDEREAALTDPAFIESELYQIDANHDGWLEASELFYFDANNNQILDPAEQTGIGIAQHLLAVQLVKRFDADEKGFLSAPEFNDLKQSCLGTPPSPPFGWRPPVGNTGPQYGIQDVESFLKSQTLRQFKALPMDLRKELISNQMQNPNAPIDQTQLFKAEVEYYWKTAGSHSN